MHAEIAQIAAALAARACPENAALLPELTSPAVEHWPGPGGVLIVCEEGKAGGLVAAQVWGSVAVPAGSECVSEPGIKWMSGSTKR